MNAIELVTKALEVNALRDNFNTMTPGHEKLLNDFLAGSLATLSERSLAVSIARSVGAGSYRDPRNHFVLLGDLTKSSTGYVYYKGMSVDHYSFDRTEEDRIAEQEAAAKLLASCERQLAIGTIVRGAFFRDFEEVTAEMGVPMGRATAYSRYTFFVREDGVVAGIFYPREGEGVFSLHKENGAVVRQEFPEAYEAFHAFQNAGWKSDLVHGRYAVFKDLVERLGIPDEEIAALTGNEFVLID